MELLAILACIIQVVSAADVLNTYNVDIDAISVSGMSSGAAFANNFYVSYSKSIMGMASFAGVPYWCPMALGKPQTYVCTLYPELISVPTLIATTNVNAAFGWVDSTSHMQDGKIYIFHALNDSTILPGASSKIQDYYEYFDANIMTNLNREAEHGLPTKDYGVACMNAMSPYLNNCGFSAVSEALNHIYDDLVEPPSDQPLNGLFYEYDQTEFVTNPLVNNFDTNGGYIYVPSGCVDKSIPCKLHVGFHGCLMNRQYIGDIFAKKAGYLEIAEVNNIIMLFPQISLSFFNLYGCWDWRGFEGISNYATKNGYQISTVKAMIDRITG